MKKIITILLLLITFTVSSQEILSFDSYESYDGENLLLKGEITSSLIIVKDEVYFNFGNDGTKFTYLDIYGEEMLEGYKWFLQGIEDSNKQRFILMVREDKEVIMIADQRKHFLVLFNKQFMIKSASHSTKEGYKNIKEGQVGGYKPLKTRFDHLNKHSHGGLTKQKVYTLGALSGFGKSHTLRQIETDIFDEDLNPDSKKDVILIKCDFEQTKEEYILTKVHEKTNVPFESLMYDSPSKEVKDAFNEVYVELTSDFIFETYDTYTPDNFYKEIIKFIEPYRYEFTDEKVGDTESIRTKNPLFKKQIVLSIDNINLVEKDGAFNEGDAISNLIIAIIKLKREVKTLTIIILAQLNRQLKERVNPKEHFPRTTDFYFSSKIEHASDVQIIVHNPYLLGLSEYGAVNYDRYSYLSNYLEEKNKYAVFNTKGLVFWHYVKVRLKNSLKDFKDVFIEKVFEVDKDDTEVNKNSLPVQTPKFSQPENHYKDLKPIDTTTAFDPLDLEEEAPPF